MKIIKALFFFLFFSTLLKAGSANEWFPGCSVKPQFSSAAFGASPEFAASSRKCGACCVFGVNYEKVILFYSNVIVDIVLFGWLWDFLE